MVPYLKNSKAVYKLILTKLKAHVFGIKWLQQNIMRSAQPAQIFAFKFATDLIGSQKIELLLSKSLFESYIKLSCHQTILELKNAIIYHISKCVIRILQLQFNLRNA
ncbi:unnamed protein product [Paramecium pentaurelia]|uniref:Uncharacterized protein n=1 Tax=Paramecium pentaurelia TaxID=43138 RepID=A0A8S1YFW7_9CILI|nr:unnamed protein product [Paramecium pentaurelia]